MNKMKAKCKIFHLHCKGCSLFCGISPRVTHKDAFKSISGAISFGAHFFNLCIHNN
nr:MAG TPA: hypothetical protein [Caudoviricetes sp.]